MAFLKKGGSKISKSEAMNMIEGFHKDKKDHVRSIYYDKDNIQSLINTPGCAGVSIYFAKTGAGNTTVVLVPVNEEGQSIWESDQDKGFSALEVGNPCPPYC